MRHTRQGQLDMDTDTDTLLAMVLSLLEPPYPETAVVLDGLVQCDGDVQATADLIAVGHSKDDMAQGVAAKRKGCAADLTNWLSTGSTSSEVQPSTKKRDRKGASAIIPSRKVIIPASSSRGSPSKPSLNLMDPSGQILLSNKSTIPRLPPLTLSNPTMVAQHTPCTLHHAILPPKLACELFYFMLDLSHTWQRNKWWLFDRVVESPHRTSFFVRNRDTADDSWHEAGQYW